MKVPLLDLHPQYLALKSELDAAVLRVAASQHFILGPEVEVFEKEIAEYIGVKYALGVSSGTDALLLALMAIGVGPGDEVIVPTFSFFATAGAVSRLNAKPVFVDIDPKSFNISIPLFQHSIHSHTKAVIPVHLFGQSADMDPVMTIARERGIKVIEDAAQAIGVQYKDGRQVGTIGDIGCFSFFPSKNLGGYGDGGLVTTNDPDLYEMMKYQRVHGMHPKYYHKMIGGNFRLDALQAAVLRVKLPHLNSWSEGRKNNAELYNSLFLKAGLSAGPGRTAFDRQNRVLLPDSIYSNTPSLSSTSNSNTPQSGSPSNSNPPKSGSTPNSNTPSLGTSKDSNIPSSHSTIPSASTTQNSTIPSSDLRSHIYNQYVIRVEKRDALRDFLAKQEIATEIYYPVPFHRQECFAYLKPSQTAFPVADSVAEHSLALPIFPELKERQIAFVVESIAQFFRQ
ncbi:MAG: transcriptional regulator [Ignavibacteria bacterium RIFCSPHIGHO2_02_FULL_56_12]|nr:MAG: transcriptional regulator [Ignavibacteria bacterium RIFCSPHIGHO2_02_FULL_56_12]